MKIRFKHVFFTVAAMVAAYLIWQVGSLALRGFQFFDDTTKAILLVADGATTAVTAEWSTSTLTPFASAGYMADLEKGNLDTWRFYRSLGSPITIEPCSVRSLNIENGRGDARVVCPVAFEAVKVEVIYDFTNYSGSWQDNLSGVWKIQKLALMI